MKKFFREYIRAYHSSKKIFGIGLMALAGLLAANFSLAATDATLSFDQTTVSTAVGSSFSLVASVNPGTNEVGAVALNVVYNPAVLRLDSITKADTFNTTLAGPTINNTNGTGSLEVGLLTNPATYVTTTSDVATFVFTVIKYGNSPTVSFASTSDASAHGEFVVLTRTGATLSMPMAPTNASFQDSYYPYVTGSNGLTRSCQQYGTFVASNRVLTLQGWKPSLANGSVKIYRHTKVTSKKRRLMGTAALDDAGNWTFQTRLPKHKKQYKYRFEYRDSNGQLVYALSKKLKVKKK